MTTRSEFLREREEKNRAWTLARHAALSRALEASEDTPLYRDPEVDPQRVESRRQALRARVQGIIEYGAGPIRGERAKLGMVSLVSAACDHCGTMLVNPEPQFFQGKVRLACLGCGWTGYGRL